MNFTNSVFGSVDWALNSNNKIPKLEDFDLDISSFSEEKAMLEEMITLKGDDNWDSIRNSSELHLLQKNIELLGLRNFYHSENADLIRIIQTSRGVGISPGETIESYVNKFLIRYTQVDDANLLRIKELQTTLQKIQEQFETLVLSVEKEEDKKALNLALVNNKDFYYDVGFRCPSMLNSYQKLGFEVSGCDINRLSVNICRKLKWNVFEKDIMFDTEYDFVPGGLVGCYQVLGNVSDPIRAIKNLTKNAPAGVKFHFEVCIEPGLPMSRYGRMFPFEPGDLKELTLAAGLIPISFSNVPHQGGPQVERILAVSK